MKEPTLGNPQNTIEVLQKYNFSFQKKFGQNFLIDTHVLDKLGDNVTLVEMEEESSEEDSSEAVSEEVASEAASEEASTEEASSTAE